MPAQDDKTAYSMDEVKEHMERYLDASAQRLRVRLREAWRRQARVTPAVYAHEKTSLLRAGAR